MKRFAVSRRQASLLCLVVVSVCVADTSIGRAQKTNGESQYQPGTPFAYLFDTGAPSPDPLPLRSLAAKTGWSLVPEDTTEHRFQGDAVLLNDKLTIVLRANGPGAEVYSQTPTGLRPRAVITASPTAATSVTGISSVRVIENNPGAVMVDAAFETTPGAAPCSAAYRLTTGQGILEMCAGRQAERLFVWCKTRHVVVPSFFGDDMVFSPATCDLPRFGLPTESFLLNLIEGGDAMVMCVWRSHRQEAHAILTGQGDRRAIRGCEIQGGKDKNLWIAFLEQPGIWHERSISAEETNAPIVLEWKRPFDAKWRADLPPSHYVAQSWEFRGEEKPEEALPGRRGDDSDSHCPCWFNEDRALVRLPADAGRGPILVYPIDRSPATPLTVFCPVDVLRNTLGVGPCQYVLQTEGLASDADPTPDNVMDWVQKQFVKKREVESAGEIKERLRAMTDHVAQVQARIDQYVALVRELQTLCAAQADNEGVRDAIRTLTRILDEMEGTIAAGRETPDPRARAAELAGEIAGSIGKADALTGFERLGRQVRRIGADQDRTLSRCRMAVRWLKQQARMSAIRSPGTAELAGEIQARVERFLKHD